MNWNEIITRNQMTLIRIVAELFALIGLASGGVLVKLPQQLHLKAQRILRPAESAVRRLIVLAAHGLVVKLRPRCAMPLGKVIARKSSSKMSFRLFDQSKRFEGMPPAPQPSPFYQLLDVKTYTRNPFNIFDKMYWPKAENPKPERFLGKQFCRRLEALKFALENLPGQARRMARLIARRKLMKGVFQNPLRAGRAPGHAKNSKTEINEILGDLHYFANDALRHNTS
jgi:hypothetical protein